MSTLLRRLWAAAPTENVQLNYYNRIRVPEQSPHIVDFRQKERLLLTKHWISTILFLRKVGCIQGGGFF